MELFCGIGGFRIASESLGIKTIWANDICPMACAVYRDRFGIRELKEADLRDVVGEIPDHDLLTGGFPCQPFSSAGKKEGIRDPRGTLFQLVVDVLESKKPKMFVLENVKRLLTMERGHHFATILSSISALDYRLEWRLINAMHLGLPQNRQRVFIVGIRADAEVDERRIRLASREELSELGWDELATLSQPRHWRQITGHAARFPDWGVAQEGNFFGWDLECFSDAREPVVLKSVLQPETQPEFDFTEITKEWIPKNTPVNRFVQGVEVISNQGGGARMGYTIFGTNGVAPTLTSTTSRHYERYMIGNRYRRLTNVEYARIQGFPDDHCRAVSVYDQYALFGNAVPPAMARWALSRTIGEGVPPYGLKSKEPQGSLFDDAAVTHYGTDEEDRP